MTNPAPERLGPAKEAMLHIETARRALADAESLLRIAPRPTGLPRLRVQFPDSKDYYYQEGDKQCQTKLI